MKLNSKKVGLILAIIFFASFIPITIHSINYAEAQRPIVRASAVAQGTFYWEHTTTATLIHADDEFAELGYEWLFRLFVPNYVHEDYVYPLGPIVVMAAFDSAPHIPTQQATGLRRVNSDDGDGVLMIFALLDLPEDVAEGDVITASITPHMMLANPESLIPTDALRRDWSTGDYYVLTVTPRQGAWGVEQIVVRHNVFTDLMYRYGDMVDIAGVPAGSNVVYWSDRFVWPGMAVRIYE